MIWIHTGCVSLFTAKLFLSIRSIRFLLTLFYTGNDSTCHSKYGYPFPNGQGMRSSSPVQRHARCRKFEYQAQSVLMARTKLHFLYITYYGEVLSENQTPTQLISGELGIASRVSLKPNIPRPVTSALLQS